jgi:hypothetical protein
MPGAAGTLDVADDSISTSSIGVNALRTASECYGNGVYQVDEDGKPGCVCDEAFAFELRVSSFARFCTRPWRIFNTSRVPFGWKLGC